MAELSVRYATALFKLASEKGLLNEFLEQATFLREMLQSEEYKRIIAHPAISATEKRNILRDAFEGKIHDELLGFLHLVISKNRESFLVPGLTAFIDMVERFNGNTTATVVSAAALDEKQLATLKDMLSKKLNKRVELVSNVDPSVIGGLYIHVDGYLLDNTVKKRLLDMKHTIKRSSAG